jgi:nicotinate-nucleotide pyrophosphorylase (carboxylating)
LLEKYAVRCGGAHNHRTGLHDGFLIKDNHLALAGTAAKPLSVVDATKRAVSWRNGQVNSMPTPNIVEVEVDTLDQLQQVLPEHPNIVLLDNFTLADLESAVELRNQVAASVQLEASGNVRIETIRQIAATGVDRISSGALTHQATSLDLGLDWTPST